MLEVDEDDSIEAIPSGDVTTVCTVGSTSSRNSGGVSDILAIVRNDRFRGQTVDEGALAEIVTILWGGVSHVCKDGPRVLLLK